MMKMNAHQIATLLGLVTFVACGESGTDTVVDALTVKETAELAVLEGDGSSEVAVELGSSEPITRDRLRTGTN